MTESPFIQKNNPKISIIIPVYNTEKYVESAILSIVKQTIADVEIIVIDDGSTDNSLKVVTDIAKIDERIRALGLDMETLNQAAGLLVQVEN